MVGNGYTVTALCGHWKSQSDKTMPIITIANLKGGAGKTTLAVTLAAALANKRTAVSLIDCDPPQNSATYWATLRDDPHITAHSVGKASDLAAALDSPADWVIVDCPPRIAPMTRTAMLVADLVLVPLAPTAPELWALDSLQEETRHIADKLPPLRLVWSRWHGWRREQKLAEEVSTEYGLQALKSTLGNRTAYPNAFMQGKAGGELTGQIKANLETRKLINEVKKLCQ